MISHPNHIKQVSETVSTPPKLLMIDNYDSFTYNLVQYFLELGVQVEVHRNDAISIAQVEAAAPTHICISPGPGTPLDAGVSLALIRHFMGKTPLLGVCLGHQVLAHYAGAIVGHAGKVMHGKTSQVTHQGEGIFAGIPSPFQVTRYHSLAIHHATLNDDIHVLATSEDGEIMGIQYKDYACFGVQFHPEAILTEHGHALLQNFLNLKQA